MQIYLDNKELDFQLEKEKTLYEVINALDNWLITENFYITELTVDDKDQDFRDTSLMKSLLIDNIKEIKIKTITVLELRLSQLETIQNYFILVINNIEAENTESLIKVLDDYKDIKPFLQSNIDKIYSNDTGFIENFLSNTYEIKNHLNEIKVFSENIIIIAESRINEIIAPEEELNHIKDQFSKTAEDAGNVSILMQTGKDREAMTTVIDFVEFLKKFSRILSILEIRKNKLVEENNIREFNSILSELCTAIENSDSVLLGDLLEYEIVPVVENLLEGI